MTILPVEATRRQLLEHIEQAGGGPCRRAHVDGELMEGGGGGMAMEVARIWADRVETPSGCTTMEVAGVGADWVEMLLGCRRGGLHRGGRLAEELDMEVGLGHRSLGGGSCRGRRGLVRLQVKETGRR